MRQRFYSLRDEHLNSLIQKLDERFPDQELNILECFDAIFNPERYPVNYADLHNFHNLIHSVANTVVL